MICIVYLVRFSSAQPPDNCSLHAVSEPVQVERLLSLSKAAMDLETAGEEV